MIVKFKGVELAVIISRRDIVITFGTIYHHVAYGFKSWADGDWLHTLHLRSSRKDDPLRNYHWFSWGHRADP